MRVSSVIADIIQIVNRDHSDMQDLLKDDHTQYALRTILTADGDVLYRAAGVWTRLAKAAAGSVLLSGNAPSWGLPADLAITNQASGDVIYFDGTNWVRLAKGSAGHCLMTGTPPAWGHPTDLTITDQAQGDILFFDGSNWIRLAAGTSGQYLKTQGSGANPIWVTPISFTENVIGYNVSDDLQNSNDDERQITGITSYNKLKEILINADLSNVRIKFSCKKSIGGGTPYFRIYKNGAAVGTIRTPETTYTEYSEDLAGFVNGDLIQIYASATTADTVLWAKEFRFYYNSDIEITVLGGTTLDTALDGVSVGSPISTTNQDP